MTAATQLLDPAQIAAGWLDAFASALEAPDAAPLAELFSPAAHWRDVLGLGWDFATLSGPMPIAQALRSAVKQQNARQFQIDPRRTAPRLSQAAGEPVIEAIIQFETREGLGEGLLRIRCADAANGAPGRAWVLLTALRSLRGHDEATIRAQQQEPAFERQFRGPNWLDRRQSNIRHADRDPQVLVVGGGHAGLTAAASLGALGIDTVVVDRMLRVGDNWRLRYHGLKLHNQVYSNHFPYMPFPKTWPNYIPKDKIANWLEMYVEAMEINFWTGTSFEGATRDEAADAWSAQLRMADGTVRTLRPQHIVLATSVSGVPNLPDIPTLSRFGGTVMHSSQFKRGDEWRDKPVLVFGTGTSGHDICQDLHGNGARVTMVQRSPTLIVNVEPGAQLYDFVYYGDGPPLEDRDLLNMSYPLPVLKQAHKLITLKARELDAPLHDALEKVGFRLEFGEDCTGWPLKYRTRGGGYYFNVGCSELIAQREIGLMQYHDIDTFEAEGVRMKDGRLMPAALIVLATGYKGPEHYVPSWFGEEVARKVGKVWGFDADSQEMRNMWTRTRQPGLWFTGGSFAQCRMYSRFLAVQIKAAQLRVAQS